MESSCHKSVAIFFALIRRKKRAKEKPHFKLNPVITLGGEREKKKAERVTSIYYTGESWLLLAAFMEEFQNFFRIKLEICLMDCLRRLHRAEYFYLAKKMFFFFTSSLWYIIRIH